ncbi:hypothetical protein NE237_002732 [Protea cynaroides]|uniref:Dirigent protein n=1 Tax=Protea cynaroides TaxID=273540 RepID=A0A9Q0KFE3_9MAGN|nr:hypothetical protein NE237_002732 [Protea cynaroides]
MSTLTTQGTDVSLFSDQISKEGKPPFELVDRVSQQLVVLSTSATVVVRTNGAIVGGSLFESSNIGEVAGSIFTTTSGMAGRTSFSVTLAGRSGFKNPLSHVMSVRVGSDPCREIGLWWSETSCRSHGMLADLRGSDSRFSASVMRTQMESYSFMASLQVNKS